VRYARCPSIRSGAASVAVAQTTTTADPVVCTKRNPIADRWSSRNSRSPPRPICNAWPCRRRMTRPVHGTATRSRTGTPSSPTTRRWASGRRLLHHLQHLSNNGSTYAGAKLCAYDRASMINGAPATQQCFPNTSTAYGGLLPADLDGARLPPSGSPNYIVGQGSLTTTLAYWKFHVDWTTPSNSSLTGPTEIYRPQLRHRLQQPDQQTPAFRSPERASSSTHSPID